MPTPKDRCRNPDLAVRSNLSPVASHNRDGGRCGTCFGVLVPSVRFRESSTWLLHLAPPRRRWDGSARRAQFLQRRSCGYTVETRERVASADLRVQPRRPPLGATRRHRPPAATATCEDCFFRCAQIAYPIQTSWTTAMVSILQAVFDRACRCGTARTLDLRFPKPPADGRQCGGGPGPGDARSLVVSSG